MKTEDDGNIYNHNANDFIKISINSNPFKVEMGKVSDKINNIFQNENNPNMLN